MTTTHHRHRTTRPKLKRRAARSVLAAGLGIAVMGLTATMANADPSPPNTPRPYPTRTATQNPHSESGICNGALPPGQLPPPGYCG
jgi:hypothetical protein